MTTIRKLLFLLIIFTSSINYTQISMVADVVPGPTGIGPRDFVIFDTEMYFLSAGVTPSLYKYDGSNVTLAYSPQSADDRILFIVGYDGDVYLSKVSGNQSGNYELFKFDTGTQTMSLVAEINPSPTNGSWVQDFIVAGNYLYFKAKASDPNTAYDLYQYDGVTLAPVNTGQGFAQPEQYLVHGDTLYFYGSTNGIWSTDGVNVHHTSPSGIWNYYNAENFTRVDNKLYFSASNSFTGTELYMVENDSTHRINIHPGTDDSNPEKLFAFQGELFFVGDDWNDDKELYKVNGTSYSIIDVDPLTEGQDPSHYVIFKNELYFQASNGVNGHEWFKWDGATASMIVDQMPGPIYTGFGNYSGVPPFVIYDEVLFSSESEGTGLNGTEILSFDGDTTVMLMDINPNPTDGSGPSYYSHFKGKVVFSANDGVNGRELWEYCPVRRSNTTILVCDTYTSPSGNYTWSASGVYLDTISTMVGCDSIITIDLHILNDKYSSITRNVCFGESLNVNGTNYSSNTTNAIELFGAGGPQGCDSNVYVNLAITPEINDLATREWSELEKIVAVDRSEYGFFGSAVDISGDFAIVGAKEEGDDAFGGNHIDSAGAVYFYEKDLSGNWNVVQKAIASDREIDDRFGYSVAISGNYAIVGARNEDEDSQGENTMVFAGSAYIFHRNSFGVWEEIQKITPSDRDVGDYFGESVSITDNYAIIGAPKKNSNGDLWVGAAYIFKRNYVTGVWEEIVKLEDSDADQFDHFGTSVSIYNKYAVVSAEGEDHDAMNGNMLGDAGSAFVYEMDGNGNWNEVKKIVPADRAAGDKFGQSISISGDAIIVGAPNKEYSGQNNVGAAYIFERNGIGNWLEVDKLMASDLSLTEYDFFGSSVDITACQAVVGAKGKRHGGNFSAGSAYIFERRSTGQWIEAETLTASDIQNGGYYGQSVAISAGDVIIGSLNDFDEMGNNFLENSGAVYTLTSISPSCLPTSSLHVIDTCYSYTTPSGNNTWNVSGIYQEIGVNDAGCDSVMTFQVTIYNTPTYSTHIVSGCGSYTTPSGNNTWTSSATYSEVITNSVGCDSVMQFQVTIHPIPTPVISGITSPYAVVDPDVSMTATPSGGTFSGTGVSGSIFSPSTAGVGVHTIYYTYTDGNGCTGIDSLEVTVNPDGCISYATNVADGKIDRVELVGETVTIDESTSPTNCETYTDNTSVAPADLIQNEDYTLRITIGSCGAENWRRGQAWIDFDQNGVFDPSETLTPFGFGWDVSGFVIQAAFTVPLTAVLGTTPMRIILTENASSPTDPCLIYPNGETEDYMVEILPANNGLDEHDMYGLKVFPNPTGGEFKLEFDMNFDGDVSLKNNLGQELRYVEMSGTQLKLDLSNYENGIYYLFVRNDQYSEVIKIVKNK